MELKDLQLKIQEQSLIPEFTIFKCPKTEFVARQYIQAICQFCNRKVFYVSSLDSFYTPNIFAEEPSSNEIIEDIPLCIYRTNELCLLQPGLQDKDNLIIICHSINKSNNSCYNDNIIEIPELTEWQIADYVFSKTVGIPQDRIWPLLEITNYDIERLSLEIDRLSLFSEKEKPFYFKEFEREGVYSDLSDKNFYSLIDAVLDKNKANIIKYYKSRYAIASYTDFGFIQALYNKIRSLLLVKTSEGSGYIPSGISKNYYYMLKKSPTIKRYTEAQLLSLLTLVSDADKKIKIGELDASQAADYILISILGV